jgi:phosphoglycolate phosphatase-like HAD superfamily hydrolase
MRSVSKNLLANELEHFKIGKYFDPIVTSLEAKPKPAPDALIKCLNSMNIIKDECVIVGDSPNDIKAGKSAGISTIAVLTGLYTFEELSKEKPDFIMQSIISIKDMFSYF